MGRTINLSKVTKGQIEKLSEAAKIFQENLALLTEFTSAFPEYLDQEQQLKESIVAAKEETAKEIQTAEIAAAERIRAINVDRNLQIKADGKKAFENLAKDLGMAILTVKEFETLELSLSTVEQKMNAEIGKAKGMAEQAQKRALREQTLEHEKATIALTTTIESLQREIVGKDNTIATLKGQLEQLNETNRVLGQSSAVTQNYGKVQ